MLPQLTTQAAISLMREHYAIEVVRAESLVSERDQNFRLRTADGRRLVLKIANSAEDPVVTDFQIRALQHMEEYQRRHGTRFNAPRIVLTSRQSPAGRGKCGRAIACRPCGDLRRGRAPRRSNRPRSSIAVTLGRYLAELDLALRDFEHPGANQNLLWDMKRAADLRQLLPYISRTAVRDRVTRCLDYFEQQTLPHFDNLRWQVIHNDLNPGQRTDCRQRQPGAGRHHRLRRHAGGADDCRCCDCRVVPETDGGRPARGRRRVRVRLQQGLSTGGTARSICCSI